MSWKTLLDDLKARGWTQQRVAEEVGASQAAISDIYSGKTKDPSHSIGRGIEDLHASLRAPIAAEAKA